MRKAGMFKRDVVNIRMEIMDAINEHLKNSGSTVVKLTKPIFLEIDDFPMALNEYINSDHTLIKRVAEGGFMSDDSDEPEEVIPLNTLTTDILIRLLGEMEESRFVIETTV